jgi:S1-C subfamily serine protease
MKHNSPARARNRRPTSIVAALTLTTALVAIPATGAVAETEDRALDMPRSSGLPSSPRSPYAGLGPADGPVLDHTPSSTAGLEVTEATAEQSTGMVLVSSVVNFGEAQSAGTGMVIDERGIVVTNHHVVEGATRVVVTVVSTGKTYQATVLGTDSIRDIAVLELEDASQLATVDVDTGDLALDDDVTAVGDAGGDGGELTAAAGTVTALRTSITVDAGAERSRLRNLIEVDADVISGDSGGALLDADGEVIGMNVAASSGNAEISGYAIPISRVVRIADKILAGDDRGSVIIGQRPMLGVELYGRATQPLIAGVIAGSPAEDLGLEPGATINAVDGTVTSSARQLAEVIGSHQSGAKVTVTWTDAAGVSHSGDVELASGPVA